MANTMLLNDVERTVQAVSIPAQTTPDAKSLQLTFHDAARNRLSPARGALLGITIGVILWLALFLVVGQAFK
jgi:hypothetical protein